MKRSFFSIVIACMMACGGELRGEAMKGDVRRNRASVHSDARRFGHKIEHAFRKVGGHLQRFFTGRDTISR